MHSQYLQYTESSYNIVARTALCLGNNPQYVLHMRLIVDTKLVVQLTLLLLSGIR